MKTGIIYHEDFKKYDFGPNHPLRGYCIDGEIAFKLVKENKDLEKKTDFAFFEPTPVDRDLILDVHTEEYLDFIERLNEQGGHITLDTPVYKGMYDAVRLFAGADILGAGMLLEKTLDRAFVFGMMGHHAGIDFGGGFCLINDIAVMVEYIRKKYNLKRVLIFDYAVNAGHGTINIFYRNPEVLCIDIHQDPLVLYPGTGFPEQVGKGVGRGYTVNICLPPYTTDKHFLFAVNEIVVPIVTEYRPELIILAGLNGGHFTVNINQFMLTLKGVWDTLHLFSSLADTLSGGRLLNIGGFSLDTKLLPLGFLATVAGALDVEVPLPEPYAAPKNLPDVRQDVEEAVRNVKNIHKTYWKYL